MTWQDTLAWFVWPRAAISAMERDVPRLVIQAAQPNTQLREVRLLMAADRDMLAELATDLTALAGPVGDLFVKFAASEAARVAAEARVAELEGAAATDEAADLSAIQPVRDAFDVIASKFRAEPETPDVEPLPEPAPVEPTPEPEPPAA